MNTDKKSAMRSDVEIATSVISELQNAEVLGRGKTYYAGLSRLLKRLLTRDDLVMELENPISTLRDGEYFELSNVDGHMAEPGIFNILSAKGMSLEETIRHAVRINRKTAYFHGVFLPPLAWSIMKTRDGVDGTIIWDAYGFMPQTLTAASISKIVDQSLKTLDSLKLRKHYIALFTGLYKSHKRKEDQ